MGWGKGRILCEDLFFHTLISKSCCYASGVVLRMDLASLGLSEVPSVVSQHLNKGIDPYGVLFLFNVFFTLLLFDC